MGNINYFRTNRYNADRYEIFEDGYYDSDDIDDFIDDNEESDEESDVCTVYVCFQKYLKLACHCYCK